ncbi:MAG: MCE family protein [Bacteroidales bacterium]|nr:MCE family protein [Bacteroidales bacterium]
MKKSTVLYIGVTFVLAVFVFIWGYNFLKGRDLFKKQYVFYVRYHNVSGLMDANPVTLNGMQIGQVKNIQFTPDYSGDIMVELILNKYFPIPKDTKAKITNASILGGQSVELVLGKDKTLAVTNDTLQGEVQVTLTEQVNSALAPMKAKAEQILTNADSLISALNDALGKKGNNSLKNSLNDLQGTFHNLNKATANLDNLVQTNSQKINRILTNLDTLSLTLKDNHGQIQQIIQNTSKVTQSLADAHLAEVINNTNKAVDQIQQMLTEINDGKGTVGSLMTNDSIYREVNNSLVQLKKLLKDIRENPKRYVKFSVF